VEGSAVIQIMQSFLDDMSFLTVYIQKVTLRITSHIETCNKDNDNNIEALQTPFHKGQTVIISLKVRASH
jgi:hypothetical protein